MGGVKATRPWRRKQQLIQPVVLFLILPAIYGGHISGRRLRGVKINPIYQENDSGRQGDGSDSQSDGGNVPVGEIQIEVYESLPRQPTGQGQTQASHDEGGPHLDGLTQSPFVCSGHVSDTTDVDSEKEFLRFSDYSLPRSNGRQEDAAADGHEEHEQGHKQREERSVGKDPSGVRGTLMRQHRIDATSDDPDVIEVIGLSPAGSNKSSPAPSSYTSPSLHVSRNKLRAPVKPARSKFLRKNRQLSAVQEMSCASEDDLLADASDKSGVVTVHEESNNEEDDDKDDDDDVVVGGVIVADGENGAFNQDCKLESQTKDELEESAETCHVVTITGEKDGIHDDLYSSYDHNCDSSDVRRTDFIIGKEYDVPSLSPQKNGLIPRSKAMYSLNKIAMLPSYNDIHHTSPVTSVDYINNNNDTMPDLMLQRNGRLNGMSHHHSPVPGLVKQSPDHHGEDFVLWDTQSLRALYSLSNTSSLDSEFKSLNKDKSMPTCDCGGRPTLKCSCGRRALQKLLKEKKMIRDNEDDWTIYGSKSVSEEMNTIKSVQDWTKLGIENDDVISNWSQSVHSDNDHIFSADSPVKHQPPPTQSPPLPQEQQLLKSALHSGSGKKRLVCKIECKMVSFSKDTVFNGDKGVKYIKECYNPSDMPFLISDFLDEEGGMDNPVFEDWEGGGRLTDDDKVKRKSSFKHPSAKNKIVSNGSLILQASDLNAPAYMHSYLKGIQGCDVIRGSPKKSGERAAPVSIEAIGGITIDDPDLDGIGTAAEEEFEYYRRRRKLKQAQDGDVEQWVKKIDRPKKIKICVTIVTVIVLVITGIALAIHFGAPGAGSMVGPANAKSEESDTSRFSHVLF